MPVFTIGNVTLNTATQEVYRGSRRIQLTVTEFSLLSFLIQNPNSVKTREEILVHVWELEEDTFMDTVEQHINLLRNKIDRPFPDANPLIHKIQGLGYKLSKRTS